MAEVIRNNRDVYRGIILADAILNVPTFESYKKMCNLLKDKNHDYQDFELIYMYFAAGGRDLNAELIRPSDCHISDLPPEIMREIMKPVDLRGKFRARKVSKAWDTMMSNQLTNFDYIRIEFDDEIINLRINNELFVKYSKFIEEYEDCTHKYFFEGEWNFLQPEFPKQAFEDIEKLMKHPNLQVGYLEIDVDKNAVEYEISLNSLMNRIKKARVTPLRVSKFRTNHAMINNLNEVLEMLDPSALKEKLSINVHEDEYDASHIMSRFPELKKITILGLGTIQFSSMENYLQNLEFFDFCVTTITKEEIGKLIKMLLRSTNFTDGSISFKNQEEEAHELVEGIKAPYTIHFYDDESKNDFNVDSPDSEHSLEVYIGHSYMELARSRKKRFSDFKEE